MFSGIQIIPVEEVRSSRVRSLSQYWETKKAGRRLPDRDDFDLADLTSLLPYMLVVGIEIEPFRVFYRLTGTKVVEMNGIELRGRYLDSLGPEQARWVDEGMRVYRICWQQQMPIFATYTWPTDFGAAYDVEFGIFPVTFQGKATQCLALEDWDFDDGGRLRHTRLLPFVETTSPIR
ncbi:MAG: PAS domain-containing protein [Dongiaceae bacterium]